MSATARRLYAVASPDAPETRSCSVRDIDCQLKVLRDAIEQRHWPTAPLRSVGTRAEVDPPPLEAMIDWATSAGAAVARIRRTDAHTSVTAFVSVLSTGRAPVISPGSARLLHALHGRRVAQLSFLEGLLRRHTRHRAILVVVDDRATLDADTAWLVQQLAALLHDVAVTWVHPPRLQPAPAATVARGAADTRPLSPRRPRFGWLALTDTEIRVVRLVVQGHTNRATAAALFVSANTISTHLRSIYSKLGVNSRVQLTRVALNHLSEEDPTPAPLPRRLDEGAPR